MFDSSEYPQSLDEQLFEQWLEAGRESRIPYAYMLLLWDETSTCYRPLYVEERAAIHAHPRFGSSPEHQTMIAAYDLFSESRIV